MGLDMYLQAEKYVSGYNFANLDGERPEEFRNVIEAAGLQGLLGPESNSASVAVTVAYWRKANAIHSWFVNNVQDGKDECQRSYVSEDQLRELLDTVTQILDTYDGDLENVWQVSHVEFDKGLADELLAPKSGFFFGSYDMDGYYLSDLYSTQKQITAALESAEKVGGVDFYYRASW